jgi:FKBP-type peptidyl-prolyl cis-trans isomerase (trigger factor)
MGEYSLDVDSIRNDVEKTLKEEEEKLEDSPLKSQAKTNADAIFDSDLNKSVHHNHIHKILSYFATRIKQCAYPCRPYD